MGSLAGLLRVVSTAALVVFLGCAFYVWWVFRRLADEGHAIPRPFVGAVYAAIVFSVFVAVWGLSRSGVWPVLSRSAWGPLLWLPAWTAMIWALGVLRDAGKRGHSKLDVADTPGRAKNGPICS